MATGPEHFKKAEDFLKEADAENPSGHYRWDVEERGYFTDRAQTHALLALTAATLDAGTRPVVRGAQWAAVLKGEDIPAIGGFQFEDLNSIPKPV